jgi:hypothetical protein
MQPIVRIEAMTTAAAGRQQIYRRVESAPPQKITEVIRPIIKYRKVQGWKIPYLVTPAPANVSAQQQVPLEAQPSKKRKRRADMTAEQRAKRNKQRGGLAGKRQREVRRQEKEQTRKGQLSLSAERHASGVRRQAEEAMEHHQGGYLNSSEATTSATESSGEPKLTASSPALRHEIRLHDSSPHLSFATGRCALQAGWQTSRLSRCASARVVSRAEDDSNSTRPASSSSSATTTTETAISSSTSTLHSSIFLAGSSSCTTPTDAILYSSSSSTVLQGSDKMLGGAIRESPMDSSDLSDTTLRSSHPKTREFFHIEHSDAHSSMEIELSEDFAEDKNSSFDKFIKEVLAMEMPSGTPLASHPPSSHSQQRGVDVGGDESLLVVKDVGGEAKPDEVAREQTESEARKSLALSSGRSEGATAPPAQAGPLAGRPDVPIPGGSGRGERTGERSRERSLGIPLIEGVSTARLTGLISRFIDLSGPRSPACDIATSVMRYLPEGSLSNEQRNELERLVSYTVAIVDSVARAGGATRERKSQYGLPWSTNTFGDRVAVPETDGELREWMERGNESDYEEAERTKAADEHENESTDESPARPTRPKPAAPK